MDFKKYLVVLIFFVLGVVVGKNMPAFNSESNTAATTTGSNTVVAPTSDSKTTTTTNTSNTFVPQTNTYDPYAITPTTNTTTTTTTQPQTYTNPPITTTDIKPVTTTTNPTSPVVPVNQVSVNYVFSQLSPLTKSLYRGNINNDLEQVKDLQTFLVIGNFLAGTVDGKFGPMTQKAVTIFQNINRLTPDGYVGPITRSLINNIIKNPLDFSQNRQNPGDTTNCPCTSPGGRPGIYADPVNQSGCMTTNKCELTVPSLELQSN